MAKTALMIFTSGSEEMEVVIPVVIMRRSGVIVTMAGLRESTPIAGSENVIIKPDCTLEKALEKGPYDIIVLPGNRGAEELAMNPLVKKALQDQDKRNGYIAAICGAPYALNCHGIGYGKKITSYIEMKDKVMDGGHYTYLEERVVHDGNLITSRTPGTCFEFAIKIVELLVGKDQADYQARWHLIKM